MVSYISAAQWKKILKALAYSFFSGFTGSLALFATDFIKAAQDGTAGINMLVYALVAGAVVGGINSVAVFFKQLFTDPDEEPSDGADT